MVCKISLPRTSQQNLLLNLAAEAGKLYSPVDSLVVRKGTDRQHQCHDKILEIFKDRPAEVETLASQIFAKLLILQRLSTCLWAWKDRAETQLQLQLRSYSNCFSGVRKLELMRNLHCQIRLKSKFNVSEWIPMWRKSYLLSLCSCVGILSASLATLMEGWLEREDAAVSWCNFLKHASVGNKKML